MRVLRFWNVFDGAMEPNKKTHAHMKTQFQQLPITMFHCLRLVPFSGRRRPGHIAEEIVILRSCFQRESNKTVQDQ